MSNIENKETNQQEETIDVDNPNEELEDKTDDEIIELSDDTSESESSGEESRFYTFSSEASKNHPYYPTKFDKLLGKPAPVWESNALLPDEVVRKVSSTEYIGKYTILVFYPADFGRLYEMEAPIEIFYINDNYDKFLDFNLHFVGCSVDSYHTHGQCFRHYRKTFDLKFPLLADVHYKVSSAFGLFSEKMGHTYRAAVIIDPKGVIVDGIRVPKTDLIPIDRIVERLVKGVYNNL